MENKLILIGQTDGLQGCCGAEVVYALSTQEIDNDQPGVLSYYNEPDALNTTDHPGLMLATTVASQKYETAELLKRGFKPVLTWTNRNTKNRITLFALGKFSLPNETTKRAKTTARRRSTKVGSKRSNG